MNKDQPLLVIELSKAWSPEARAAAAEARRGGRSGEEGGGASGGIGRSVNVKDYQAADMDAGGKPGTYMVDWAVSGKEDVTASFNRDGTMNFTARNAENFVGDADKVLSGKTKVKYGVSPVGDELEVSVQNAEGKVLKYKVSKDFPSDDHFENMARVMHHVGINNKNVKKPKDRV